MARELEHWRRISETDLAVVQSFGAFSPGGRYLASADTNTIEVRESRSGLIVATMEMGGVTSLAIHARTDRCWSPPTTMARSMPGPCRLRSRSGKRA